MKWVFTFLVCAVIYFAVVGLMYQTAKWGVQEEYQPAKKASPIPTKRK